MTGTRRDRALRLTPEELEAMDTGALTAVAQAVGTSGRYTSRADLLRRIQAQQEAARKKR